MNALEQIRLADPTRTTTLRAEWVREMRARWARIRWAVEDMIVDNDALGLAEAVPVPSGRPVVGAAPVDVARLLRRPRYAFERTETKVDGFMSWLSEQEAAGILELEKRPGIAGPEPWTNLYVRSAYSRGIARGRAELRKAGWDVLPMMEEPDGLRGVMNQPFHASRVANLYTRVFDELKTVTAYSDGEVRKDLVDGLTKGLARGIAEGKHPRVIAREINAAVQGRIERVAIGRSELIARTETIRAHHLANVEEFRQADAEMKVRVLAEILTHHNPCPVCDALAARSRRRGFTLDEIEGLIPVHPRCRCCAIPAKSSVGGRTPRRRIKPAVVPPVVPPAPTVEKTIEKAPGVPLAELVLQEQLKLQKEYNDLCQRDIALSDIGIPQSDPARSVLLDRRFVIRERIEAFRVEANQIDQVIRLTQVETLYAKNQSSARAVMTPYLKKKMGESILEGQNAAFSLLDRSLTSEVFGEVVPSVRYKGLSGFRSRAYYQGGVVHLGAYDGPSIAAHEVGHWIEDAIPHVHARAVEFLRARAGDEPLRSLRSVTGKRYGIREVCYVDRFRNPYSGKYYSNFSATEIVSMGVQALCEDAAAFRAEDPEYYRFVVGLLRGWL